MGGFKPCCVVAFCVPVVHWQPTVVIGLLAMSGAHRRLQLILLARVVAHAIALGGLALAPARTAWVHFVSSGHGAINHPRGATCRRSAIPVERPLRGYCDFTEFSYGWRAPLHLGTVGICLGEIACSRSQQSYDSRTPVIGAHYFIDTIRRRRRTGGSLIG